MRKQFAACSYTELITNSDTLALFFTKVRLLCLYFLRLYSHLAKVFGPSPSTRTASGTLLAISSAGNIMSATFAAVRGECYFLGDDFLGY